ncbi:MAG TPA: sigma-70 family RNA polymerase sigma factor [Candidatus Marinimicrobia bacterium]|nr:sigma-70 family RNA polymerase sigma factor [Candidatus Neomarinimicrobiota bacterium]HRS50898.1 sigma-70 family RNA polymerase sigma factor [Candidatus Neomarinimicrobiota bacterium]HRU91760.1 sigma-70 family RNA polymerase sigma factor [Candidatus Neomarinimicrobiota bacterium]
MENLALLTDQEIIDACLAGNENAFTEIIRRYESRVAATVIGMLGRCPEAEDVGQETFIRFYKSMSKFRGESSLSTYLTRIAMNLSINELNRRKRQSRFVPLDDPEISRKTSGDSGNQSDSESGTIVHWAVAQLAPKFRSTVVLRLMEGYSTEETAQILQLPVGTVLSRLARAKAQLLNLLAPYKEQL